MPALNFHPRFVDAIRDGSKRQTIRAPRRHPIKPGDRLFLFTGMRQANCERVGVASCIRALRVRIEFGDAPRAIVFSTVQPPTVSQTPTTLAGFAARDGFESWDAFVEFFARAHRGAVVFEGALIRWNDFQEGQGR